jgi:MFS family permease
MITDTPPATSTLTGLHRRIFAMSWAGFFFDAYTNTVLSFISVAVIADLHLAESTYSRLVGLQLAATAAGGILFGWLGDAVGRKKSLQYSILLFAFGSLLTGVTHGTWMLFVARIIAGIGVGGEWGVGQTLVGETFPAVLRGRFAALLQAASPLSIMLSSVVGSLLAPAVGWRWAMVLSAAPAVLVLIVRVWMPESPVWEAKASGGRKTERIPLREMRAMLWRPPYRKTLIVVFALTAFDMFAFWIPYTWLPNYLAKERHINVVHSLGWFMVLQTGSLLGYLTFGWVADRWGRRLTLTAYSVVLALGIFSITLLWNRLDTQTGLLQVAMFVTGVGTGTFSGIGPLVVENFPTEVRSTVAGFVWNVARALTFFGPVMVTGLAPLVGLSGGISIAGVFALCVAGSAWLLPETAGRTLAA